MLSKTRASHKAFNFLSCTYRVTCDLFLVLYLGFPYGKALPIFQLYYIKHLYLSTHLLSHPQHSSHVPQICLFINILFLPRGFQLLHQQSDRRGCRRKKPGHLRCWKWIICWFILRFFIFTAASIYPYRRKCKEAAQRQTWHAYLQQSL